MSGGLFEIEFEAGFIGGRRGGGFLGGEDGFDGEELDGVEDDVAVGAFVGDGDGAGFAFFEAEDAEGFEELFFLGFLALVEGEGLGAVGVVDGDGDVGGAVVLGDVGDGDAVLAGGGDVRGEGGGLGAFVFVAVVAVAFVEEAGHGGGLGVEAGEFGVVVVNDDAADLVFGDA